MTERIDGTVWFQLIYCALLARFGGVQQAIFVVQSHCPGINNLLKTTDGRGKVEIYYHATI